jgi:hypothetical protein
MRHTYKIMVSKSERNNPLGRSIDIGVNGNIDVILIFVL